MLLWSPHEAKILLYTSFPNLLWSMLIKLPLMGWHLVTMSSCTSWTNLQLVADLSHCFLSVASFSWKQCCSFAWILLPTFWMLWIHLNTFHGQVSDYIARPTFSNDKHVWWHHSLTARSAHNIFSNFGGFSSLDVCHSGSKFLRQFQSLQLPPFSTSGTILNFVHFGCECVTHTWHITHARILFPFCL